MQAPLRALKGRYARFSSARYGRQVSKSQTMGLVPYLECFAERRRDQRSFFIQNSMIQRSDLDQAISLLATVLPLRDVDNVKAVSKF
jgi:hypothetical protein